MEKLNRPLGRAGTERNVKERGKQAARVEIASAGGQRTGARRLGMVTAPPVTCHPALHLPTPRLPLVVPHTQALRSGCGRFCYVVGLSHGCWWHKRWGQGWGCAQTAPGGAHGLPIAPFTLSVPRQHRSRSPLVAQACHLNHRPPPAKSCPSAPLWATRLRAFPQ